LLIITPRRTFDSSIAPPGIWKTTTEGCNERKKHLHHCFLHLMFMWTFANLFNFRVSFYVNLPSSILLNSYSARGFECYLAGQVHPTMDNFNIQVCDIQNRFNKQNTIYKLNNNVISSTEIIIIHLVKCRDPKKYIFYLKQISTDLMTHHFFMNFVPRQLLTIFTISSLLLISTLTLNIEKKEI